MIGAYDSGLVGPRLQDVATGGVGDSFVLLPRIWDVGGLLRALSSPGAPGGQSIISVFGNGNAQYAEKPL